MSPRKLSLYLHWPFCLSKCPYCDFNSHVRDHIDQDQWLQAYRQELRFQAQQLPNRKLTSIFFGGGTPSLMDAKLVEQILEEIAQLWQVPNDIEVTLEANPQTVEAAKFKDFRAAGINRVSMGIQSLNDKSLKFLGRLHDGQEALRAIGIAQKVFDRYSLDFIYALPGQLPQDWRQDLQEILPLIRDHISAYQLTIEPGTAFHTLYQRKSFQLPDEDTAAALYDLTGDVLSKVGFAPYEISNYAAPGSESQHNLNYWRYGDYLGIGPGAHGRVTQQGNKYAVKNYRAPETWLKQVQEKGHGMEQMDVLTSRERAEEMLMMGLRLQEGVDLTNFQQEVQRPLQDFVDMEALDRLVGEGLVTYTPTKLWASLRGRRCLNAVLGYLVKAVS